MFAEGLTNAGHSNPSNLIETTDCLEAIGVFRSWKNFLFIILLLCMAFIQATFWVVKLGMYKVENVTEQQSVTTTSPAEEQKPAVAETIEAATKSIESEKSETLPVNEVAAAAEAVVTDVNETAAAVTSEEPAKMRFEFGTKVSRSQIEKTIQVFNFILIMGGIPYCLTLLFSLKVSLVGRLGGINHIARAFFWSLIFLVLLLPWQLCFGPMARGLLFFGNELFSMCDKYSEGVFEQAYLYLRFVAYWFVVLIFLMFAQMRSCRWARAILRRLEVV